MRIRPAFWGVLIVLIFGISGYALTSALIYQRLVYFAAFLILVSFVWTRISLQGVSFKRTARFLRQSVGQVYEERFELTNEYPVTKLWIEIRDQSSLPGRSGSKVLTWVGSHQRRSYVAYTRLTHRGEFHLGPTVVSSGDPFGLFSSAITYPADRTLLVLPFMVDLKSTPVPPGILPGGRALRRKTVEVTPYAAGVREYAPGDGLNRIHWASTARKDRLMVKEFDQDPQADIWILLDAQEGEQLHLPEPDRPDDVLERQWIWRQKYRISLPNHTFDYVVSTAASMANYYVQLGRSVGLVSAGKTFMVLPAEKGERQLGKILEMLAYIQADGNLPLSGVVESQAPHLTRGGTVVIITPSGVKKVELAVEELLHRALEPVVVLIDRVSFGGQGDPQALMLHLRSRHIPVVVLSRNVNIKAALEEGF